MKSCRHYAKEMFRKNEVSIHKKDHSYVITLVYHTTNKFATKSMWDQLTPWSRCTSSWSMDDALNQESKS